MRSSRWLWTALLAVLILPSGGAVPAGAADTREPFHMVVEYLEFPPYYYTNSSLKPDGFLLQLAAEAFKQAGVQVTYESLPAGQILNNMHSDRAICSIGWFRTPEREAFARFSRRIYKNRPVEVVFLNKNSSLFRKHTTLAGLVRDKSLTLGRAKGYSQGEVVDGIIARGNPPVKIVNGSFADLFRMLADDGLSYFIVASEYIDYQIRQNHLNAALFEHKKMTDIPEGNSRHLMYSRGVPDSVIRRIDKALDNILKDMEK